MHDPTSPRQENIVGDHFAYYSVLADNGEERTFEDLNEFESLVVNTNRYNLEKVE